MSRPHVSYTPRPDATPEGELAALANVYSFVLQRYKEEKTGGPEINRPKRPEGDHHDDQNSENIIRE